MSKQNPIAEKLMKLIASGKMTKEKICVAADLKYPTLENVFFRKRVSYVSLKSLKFAGIINEQDIMKYNDWLENNTPKRQKKNSKPHKVLKPLPKDYDADEENPFSDEG